MRSELRGSGSVFILALSILFFFLSVFFFFYNEKTTVDGSEKQSSWCARYMTCLNGSGRGVMLEVSKGARNLHNMGARVCVPSSDYGVEIMTEDEGVRPVYVRGRAKANSGSAVRFEERDNYKGVPTGVFGGEVIPPPKTIRGSIFVDSVYANGENVVRQFHSFSASSPRGACYLIAVHPEDVASQSVTLRLRGVDLDQVHR